MACQCVMQGAPTAGPGHLGNLVQQSHAGHRRPPVLCSGMHWVLLPAPCPAVSQQACILSHTLKPCISKWLNWKHTVSIIHQASVVQALHKSSVPHISWPYMTNNWMTVTKEAATAAVYLRYTTRELLISVTAFMFFKGLRSSKSCSSNVRDSG